MAILGYRLAMTAMSTTLISSDLMMMTLMTATLGCRVLAGGACCIDTPSGRLMTGPRGGRYTVCTIVVAAHSAPAFRNQRREVVIPP